MGLGDGDGTLNISDYMNWAASGASPSAPSTQSLLQLLPGEATPGTSPFSLSMAAGLVDSGGNPITPSGSGTPSGTPNPNPTPTTSMTWLLVGAGVLVAIAMMSGGPARYGR